MSIWASFANKAQDIAQSTAGKGMDAVAFLGGIAVWQEWVPTAVGVVTIVWLSMQILLNIPRLVKVWYDSYTWIKSKFKKDK